MIDDEWVAIHDAVIAQLVLECSRIARLIAIDTMSARMEEGY